MTITEVNEKYGTNIPEILKDGEAGNPEKWEKEGRARLKEILQREEYGVFPQYDKKNTTFNIVEESKVPNIPVIRRHIEITINFNGKTFTFKAYMFLPEGKKKVPVFLNINRHTWMSRSVSLGIIGERFPVEEITGRGYGLVYYDTDEIALEDYTAGIIEHEEGYKYTDYRTGLYKTLGLSPERKDSLGAIGLWAFAAMRVMDYLETAPEVDETRVAVVGHSRLGKTALVTAAFDERFAMGIPNSSGCGGSALFKTKIGEHVEYMVDVVPYWFCRNYEKYVNNEQAMEFDQHYLISLVAPRSVYVQSSELDDWADPQAEFTSACLASEVYEKVYGIKGLVENGFPKVDSPLQEGNIAYHVRTGDHNHLLFDWRAYMDFADKQFGMK